MRFLIAVLLLALGAGAAFAQELPDFLKPLDSDRNGTVSRAEFDRARQADYDRLDRDGSGRVDETEFLGPEAAQPDNRTGRRRARFREIDRDGDGDISRAEYFAFGRGQFDRLDRDGNGAIGAQEAAAGREHPAVEQPPDLFSQLDADADGYITLAELDAARRESHGSLDRDGSGELNAAEFALGGRPDSPERFRALDTNGNGSITLQEFLLPGRAMIGRVDADNDGRLSRAEFEGRR